MSSQDCPTHITDCETYLSQGDIFHIDLVAPMADLEKIIFRTVDGRHGGNISPAGMNGKLFDYDELLKTLESLPPEQRLLPFQRAADGKIERVLVYADLLKYFVVLSHTCDISGVDAPAKPTCTIAPVITLAQHCQGQIPFSYKDPETEEEIVDVVSIPEYITRNFDSAFIEELSNCLSFPDYIRTNLPKWRLEASKRSPERRFVGVLKSTLDLVISNKPQYLYYIAPDREYKVPESYIDFCRLYTISMNIVERLMDTRIATIITPYKEEFARKFAEYYARIATPIPMRGPSIE